MSENVFYTSDLHFGHKKVLEFCPNSRMGFTNVDLMNDKIVNNWNKKVSYCDRVYILGDVSFMDNERTLELLSSLRGHLHLIVGNHDERKLSRTFTKVFSSVNHYKTIKVNDQKVVMLHYPMEEWDGSHYGAIHLHGHLHGSDGHGDFKVRKIKNRVDIGIDTRTDLNVYSHEEMLEYVNDHNRKIEEQKQKGFQS